MLDYITMRNIYVITYLPTGKKYVGKSKDVESRFKTHISFLQNHKHPSADFQADYDKYGGGLESFKVEIVDYQLGGFADRYDQEHTAMMKFKTYDKRYGYNASDQSIQWMREKQGLPRKNFGWHRRRELEGMSAT